MQIWQDLIKYSLIGTERQNTPLVADGDLQSYIQQLYPNNSLPTGEAREQAFLSAAALVSQYRLAGQQASSFNGNVPTGDESEALPVLSPLAINHLQRLLNDSQVKALLSEWLDLAVHSKRRVPFSMIPTLLELATQNRSIRPAITTLIDKRGLWLAKQHPDWHKVVVQTDDLLADESLWEEGNTAQREEFLRQYRQQEADKARELLQNVWKQESADTRRTLLATFNNHLSEADEAFLTTCLDDRSKVVRQTAATLLGQLANSAFSQRQKQRLQQWLRIETSGLFKKTQLIVELPETYDKTWLNDGIDEKPPQGTGAKAWWLQQALSYVPPSYWSEHWQLSPEQIIKLIEKHDWRDALLIGWQQALLNYPNAAWAEVFLLQIGLLSNNEEATLWKTIPATQAERLLSQLLTHDNLTQGFSMLRYVQHHWSVEFSRCVIEALCRYLQQKVAQSELHKSELYSCFYQNDFGRYLAPECCDLLIQHLQTVAEQDSIVTRELDKVQFILLFRRDMANVLNNQH